MANKWHDEVVQTTQVFLGQLGIEAKVNVAQVEDIYQVNLECANPGILICHHGETLFALQLLLGQHLKAKTGEWVSLAVNVNDYRERREQSLRELADNTVEQVVATGQPYTLPPMPAGERRIVHLYLADHSGVKTESMGTGRSRSVIISPK